MVRNDIKNSSLLKTKFLIYAFNGRTRKWRLIASCCNAFCSKTHCNMQQNALYFASKRIVFCIKTHCILHQNALQYAPKRKAKCNETQGEMLQNVTKTHQKHHIMRYL